MAGIALVACPCHLPITLPILISATAGTVIGVWLENNAVVVTGVATVIFLGGSLLAFKWLVMGQEGGAVDHSRKERR